MLYNLEYIVNDILEHVESREPFSLVRLGDGDLKLLSALTRGKVNKPKFDRSGIPYDKKKWLMNLYKNSCNNANYTSSFEMYNSENFWKRSFSKGASKLIKSWKQIYDNAGIINGNFCSPEIGHLLFLDDINFLREIKGRRIGLITCFKQAATHLKQHKIKLILIPALNNGHYNKYKTIIKEIKKADVDLFLVGAGALGKGYLNVIKYNGSVGIDIGQVMNVWAGRKVAKRFNNVISYNRKTTSFILTKQAKKFRKFL